MERIKIGLCGLVIVLIFSGCGTTGGNTPQAKRQSVINMRNAALSDLYNERPGAKAKIASAPGYAVFSNFDIALFLISGGAGHGVVTRKGGKRVFMKMASIPPGVESVSKRPILHLVTEDGVRCSERKVAVKNLKKAFRKTMAKRVQKK